MLAYLKINDNKTEMQSKKLRLTIKYTNLTAYENLRNLQKTREKKDKKLLTF